MDSEGDKDKPQKNVGEPPALGYAQLRFAEMMDMNKDAVVTRVSHYLDAAEVALHNSPDDCWCIYNGKVYDITRYLDMHPGGRDHLLEYAGKDVTEEFYGVHPWVNAEILLKSLFVGEIKPQVHGEIIAASDNDRGEE